jgi:hypothetical protein
MWGGVERPFSAGSIPKTSVFLFEIHFHLFSFQTKRQNGCYLQDSGFFQEANILRNNVSVVYKRTRILVQISYKRYDIANPLGTKLNRRCIVRTDMQQVAVLEALPSLVCRLLVRFQILAANLRVINSHPSIKQSPDTIGLSYSTAVTKMNETLP